MPSAILDVPAVLAPTLGGRRTLDLEYDAGATVGALLDRVGAGHPVFARRIRTETGAVRRFVNVFVGQDNIRDLAGLDTPVPDGARILVIQSVAGG
ncbi:MoaD/ThiS family protein [Zafaria sp. Z1313]|uniref:MoaD/ThiS family protein n=1 Tax=unclassified Zafaria TaxID=2828765 RepID=UPI002E78EC2E|nr:MoaD/ThiS family protein [Zafaria sp. J156]MEE1621058.1 MoaD/ThiS family protein [Zafaria sp. J156]